MTATQMIPEPKPDPSGLTSLPTATARELVRQNPSGLRAECDAALRMVEPIRPEVFAVEFERMLVHYWHGALSVAEGRVLRADWLRLLGHLPADLMREGVDRYLLSTNRHKPTPGVFLELVAADLRYRQALAKRANETLALLTAANDSPAPAQRGAAA